MSAKSQLETTKQIVAIINSALDVEKNEILKVVSEALKGNVKSKAKINIDKIKVSWAGKLGLIVFLMILLALIFSVPIYANNVGGYRELKASDLFQLIVFVFALSSYLASVARDTAKTLGITTDIADCIKYKKHIFYMLTAEMPLILLGMLAILRLVLGSITWLVPCINRCLSFDTFLLSFLGVILLGMICLHARIWWMYEPWNVYKEPSKVGN